VQYARSATDAITEGPHRRTRTVFWSRFGVMLTTVVTTVAVYWWIVNLQAHGRSAAALNMPEIGMTDIGKYWAFPVLQASGLTGLVFAYLSVLLGLQQSGRAVSWFPLTYRQINRIHRQVSLMVVGLVLIHVVATVFDAMGNTWQSVLLPGAVAATGWPAAVWGFNTGILAFYALLLLAPTFYARRRIGIRRWRFLHRFVAALLRPVSVACPHPWPRRELLRMDPANDMACASPAACLGYRAHPTARKVEFRSDTSIPTGTGVCPSRDCRRQLRRNRGCPHHRGHRQLRLHPHGLTKRSPPSSRESRSYMQGNTNSVDRVIGASASAIFALLCDPSTHSRFDGSGTVNAALAAHQLSLGSTFVMAMRGRRETLFFPYRTTNTVIEFEPDRRIAWKTTAIGGLVGGRIWRYELDPADSDSTLVRET
jgi:hypothetical protein